MNVSQTGGRPGSGKDLQVLLDCKTAGFVNMLGRKKAPKKAYIGRICRRLKDRLEEQKYDI